MVRKGKLIGVMAMLMTGSAFSQELVVNGGFEASTPGWVNYTTLLGGWTVSKGPGQLEEFDQTIAAIFEPDFIGRDGIGLAPTTNQTQSDFNLYGPSLEDGGNGGIYSGTLASMENSIGGNYLVMDGDPIYSARISQTISGLTIGGQYELKFDWASGQMRGVIGDTTSLWAVSFGDSTHETAEVPNLEGDFQPWKTESVIFTATEASHVLSFLAKGTPVGMPPISLLDNVSLQAVPEPGIGLFVGLGAFLALFTRRRKS